MPPVEPADAERGHNERRDMIECSDKKNGREEPK
jgi:hypothetical protein